MRWTELAGLQLMHCRENSIDSADGGRIHPVLVAKDAVGGRGGPLQMAQAHVGIEARSKVRAVYVRH